jgi:hypothetical protein
VFNARITAGHDELSIFPEDSVRLKAFSAMEKNNFAHLRLPLPDRHNVQHVTIVDCGRHASAFCLKPETATICEQVGCDCGEHRTAWPVLNH